MVGAANAWTLPGDSRSERLNKVMLFLRAAPTAPRDDFQQSILWMARAGLVGPLASEAMTVNLVRMPPDNLPYRPPSDSRVGLTPDYDAIVEIWSPRSASAVAGDVRDSLADRVSVFHAYAVTETLIYHRRGFPQGQPSTGVKLIGRLMFHADMPDSAVRRSWSLHAVLAGRVHTGSARYVQNWVDEALTDPCPPTRGIPIMHFPTEREFQEQFVDSPRGMQDILQDTAHFVAGGPRFYNTEYIVRPPP
jgi:hypothetical protein